MSPTVEPVTSQVLHATEPTYDTTMVADMSNSNNNNNNSNNDSPPSPSTMDNPNKSPDPTRKLHRSKETAPWRSGSCFLGREKELKRLHHVNKKVMESSRSRIADDVADSPSKPTIQEESSQETDANENMYPAVLVWGISGTGKSALIDHFLQECCTCNTEPKQKTDKQKEEDKKKTAANTCTCCYVLRGKYDEYTGGSDPFSALIQAMRDFTSQLKRGPVEELDRIRRCVKEAFPTDGFIPLIKVVPALAILAPNATIHEDGSITHHSTSQRRYSKFVTGAISNAGSMSVSQNLTEGLSSSAMPAAAQLLGDSSWNQLQYIFMQFIKAISTTERPIYMFLDDLQWSSGVGLRLLASLMEDTDLKNFLLVGAVRQETNPHNEEVLDLPPNHALSTAFLQKLEATEDSDGGPSHGASHRQHRTLSHVTIANLSLADTTAWLENMLCCEDIDILSKKLHIKTNGNIFFTLQALEELERKNILTYNQASSQWEWKVPNQGGGKGSSSFRTVDLPISHNIVHAIESKLKDLPPLLQRALSVAAYIGSTFHLSILRLVLQNEQGHVDGVTSATIDEDGIISNEQALSELLEQAVLERLVNNPIGGTMYNFAHDRIQQAAHGMIPHGEVRDKLRLRIGHCLLKNYRLGRNDDDPLKENDDDDEHVKSKSKADGKSSSPRRYGLDEAKAQSRRRLQQHSMPAQSAQSTHSTSQTKPSKASSPRLDEIEGLLFVAVDHLNSIQTKDHMFTVMMNLEVGEKALQMGALESASNYLEKAFAALRRVKNHTSPSTNSTNSSSSAGSVSSTSSVQQAAHRSAWNNAEHYDACLRLYHARCDVELSLSHFEAGYKLGYEVLDRARSLEDKLPTYFAMAKALGREDRHLDAQQLDKRALRAMKEFPKRWHLLRSAKMLLDIKSFLKKNTNEQIMSLPLMTDPGQIYSMRIGTDFGIRSNLIRKVVPYLFNLFRTIQCTIRYGITEDAAPAFGAYGVMMAMTGDQAMAQRCADLATAVIDKTNGKSKSAIVSIIRTNFISSFNSPYLDLMRECRKGHHDSMEVGEFEMGIVNYQTSVMLGLQIGCSLPTLIKATQRVRQKIDIHQVRSLSNMARGMHLLFTWLTGDEPIPWQDFEAEAARGLDKESLDPSAVIADTMDLYAREWILIHHRRYETAERLYDPFNYFASRDRAYLMVMASPFFAGLIAAGRYRETGRRRHLATLRKSIKTLRNIGKTRGRNWIHKAFLLEAEKRSITIKNKRHSRIQNAYNLAIVTAAQSMCVHDVALACELAGEHYAQNDAPDLVSDYFDNAVDHYTAWGCKTKVDDIKERRGQFVTTRYRHGNLNPKLAEWTRRNRKLDELYGIASPANLSGFEIIPKPGPADMRSRNSTRKGIDGCTHATGSKTYKTDALSEDGEAEYDYDDMDEHDDDVSVLTYGS